MPFGNLRLIAALLVLLAALLALPHLSQLSQSLGPYPEAKTIGQGNPSFQELSDRFTSLAEKKGAVYAFQIEKLAPLPPNIDTHLLGHVIGHVLYQQEGVDGIKDCTQDFRNACSHEIVIGALNEYGTGETSIEKIREACTKAPGGSGAYTMCFHGLGHGVFAYFGYDIPKAVAFCKKLGTSEYGDQEFTQCVGGMTMELIDGGGHDHDQWVSANEKYLKPSDPLSPCDTSMIPYEAKSFCYMYLTPHLFKAAGANIDAPDPATFPKAFSYCDAISDTKLRDVCWSSFGKEFIPLAASHDIRSIDHMSDEEYSLALSWCALAPNADAEKLCVSQEVASVFWGGENDPRASFRLCSLAATGAIQDHCYEQIGVNIASYTSGDTRTKLCAQLPEKNVRSCETTTYGPSEKP